MRFPRRPPAATFMLLLLIPLAASAQKLRVTFDFDARLHQTRQEQFFYVRLDETTDPAGIRADAVVYPDGTLRDGTVWYDTGVTLRLPIRVASDAPAGTHALSLTASYQLCEDDGLCYLPQKARLEAALSVGGPAPAGSGTEASPPAALTLRLLLLAFLGGLILNFMPCVLPVLSIKALGLVKPAAADRPRMLASAGMYTAGIRASFGALAALVVGLKASGEAVGWGFQFQNPAYVVALLAVVFVFALSLFDVFTIQLPVGGLAARAGGSTGHLGSFLGGVMAVLLATPCTAPFLGTALGYAFSQPAPVIFLMFALVGLGLAAPYVLLALWPPLARVLPRPGAWTAVFRTVMGFLLVGTAVFLFDVLVRQVDRGYSVRVLVFLAILAFAAWLYGRFGPTTDRWKRWVALAAAVLISVGGGLVTLRGDPTGARSVADAGPVEGVHAGWETFSPALVSSYRTSGEPVFLAFGAQWCWSCRVNESAVLDRPEVRQAFERAGVRRVYGDWTNADDTISEWLAMHDRAGVPLYVYYAPGREPVVLPELLTRRMVLDLLEG